MTNVTTLPARVGDAPAPVPAVDRFPSTPSQQRFWILEQIAPGNSSANVALCWELRGTFHAETLEAAFRETIARHEILRTRFVEEDGVPVQEVVGHVDFRLPVVDLRTVPADQVAARIAAISAGEATTPFDLARPGLLRATLLRLAADRALMLLTVHHMCFDGYSIRVLGREIGEIAAALDAGRRPDLPELSLQYGDYALWQEAYLGSAGFEVERGFWRRTLAGMRYFEVPTDRPRGEERTNAGALVSQLLAPEVSARIEAFARSEKISVFGLAGAVLSLVLHRWTGERDVGLGTQVASREDSALEALVGVFINNLVLRFAVDPSLSFREHLHRAGDTVQDALLHQRMPFNTLVEMLNPPRDATRTPLISVNMIVQRAFLEDHRYGGFELIGRPSSTPGSLFDLNFMMIGRPEGWRASLEYNPDLFEARTAEALLAAFAGALDQLTAHPEMRGADLPGRAGDAADTSEASVAAAEVQACLASHPAVDRASVTEGSDGSREARVVPAGDFEGALDELPAQLRAHLLARLPAAALPRAIRLAMQLPGEAAAAARRAPAPAGEAASEGERVARIEAEVGALWCELLGVPSVARDANFFDLGGHSLLAVRLVARLRERLRVEIGTAVLYRAPTLGALAAQLAASRSLDAAAPVAEDNRVNEINPDAPGIPIISINNYSTIYAVSKHFTTPRRCIAVRLVDPDAPFGELPPTFEAVADAYVEMVRRIRPHGPYALFGICVHGNIALEVARRLRDAGEEVAGLFIKDVWAPAYSAKVRKDARLRTVNKWHDTLLRVRKWRRGELSVFDLLRYYPRLRANRALQAIERFAGDRLSQETRLLSTTSQGAFVQHLSAARNRYMPQPYAGDVTMFATCDSPTARLFDRSLGWRDVVTGRMRVEEIGEIVAFKGLEIGTLEVARCMEAALSAAENRAGAA